MLDPDSGDPAPAWLRISRRARCRGDHCQPDRHLRRVWSAAAGKDLFQRMRMAILNRWLEQSAEQGTRAAR
jgi:hypothetical protein